MNSLALISLAQKPSRWRALLAGTLLAAGVTGAHAQSPAIVDTGLSFVTDVNNHGQASGYVTADKANISDPISQAAMWNGSGLVLLQGGAAHAINDAGQMVGRSGEYHSSDAVMWDSDGTRTRLGPADGVAFGINNSGQAVGYMEGPPRPLYWVPYQWGPAGTGSLINGSLGIYGIWQTSNAHAINNSGQIAGTTRDYRTSVTTATLWSGNNTLRLNSYGQSYGLGLNDLGQVVGNGYAQGDIQYASHAFIWDGASVTELSSLPGTNWAMAIDINNSGRVVGSALAADGLLHAVLWVGSEIIDLNDVVSLEGIILTSADAINEEGWMAVNGVDVNGMSHGYLLAPVPLPGAAWFLLSGIGGLAFSRYRSRLLGDRTRC